MEKSIATTPATAALVDWNNPAMQIQIRQSYGKDLTDAEWNLFLNLGIATGLNPFLREIWAVKYGNQAASVFIGRDGYRRSAQNHPEYEYHFADAVCANDVYKVVSGEVTHEYTLKDRGALVGAYCIVKRKSAGKPAVTFVDLKEYYQGNKDEKGAIKMDNYGKPKKPTLWDTKPATMIKKVAEAQGLRATFQELFAGTYEESENWQEDNKSTAQDSPAPAQKPAVRKSKAAPANVIDATVSEVPQDESVDAIETPAADPVTTAKPFEETFSTKITADQTRRLFDVWAKYKAAAKMPEVESTTARRALMKDMFGVEVSTSLDERQANELIRKIEDMTNDLTNVSATFNQ